MSKLSVVISAFNEENNIEDALRSVSFADEIIVVDNSSTDDTAKIALKYTEKIYKRENNLMLNVNKNFGFTKATGEWILSLDADERVTPELKKEIESKLNELVEFDGYWIPRKNIIFNKWIEHSIWWPDYHLRLFRSGKGKFAQKHVHEYININGSTDYLESPLLHENYSHVSQYIQKMDKIYSENEVENMIKDGKRVVWQDAILYPLKDFTKTFFAQRGYKDGLHGLVLSIFQAFYAELVFAKMWEHQKFTEYNSQTFLQEIFSVLRKEGYELKHWVLSVKIDNEKRRVRRFAYKISRRINKRKIPKNV